MKREFVKTSLFALAAVLLVAAAAWVEPEYATPEIFSDQGEPLFPRFRDVMAVKAVEVIDYDETQAVARPLKVAFRKNHWVLTSHSDYPAEAGERLSKTSAALLDLKKDIVVSDRFEDQAQYGVIDPMDTKAAGLSGRGKRVTLRDAQGEVLAELVLGKAVPERAGYRYVRLPAQKRTYAVKTDADPSAEFADWVEADLLKIAAAQIKKITVNSYSIDETVGRLANVRRTVLTRENNDWQAEGEVKPGRAAIQSLVSALGQLRVTGARPKPPSLAEQLRRKQPLELSLETVMSLRQRGFFITPDGRLLSNQGEMVVETDRGLFYTLRFGELAAGASQANGAGKPEEDRYLFVTVGARGGPAGEDAERLAASLNLRFAGWYYVISGADFARLHLSK